MSIAVEYMNNINKPVLTIEGDELACFLYILIEGMHQCASFPRSYHTVFTVNLSFVLHRCWYLV